MRGIAGPTIQGGQKPKAASVKSPIPDQTLSLVRSAGTPNTRMLPSGHYISTYDAGNFRDVIALLAARRPRCLTPAQAKQAAQLLYAAWALGWLNKELEDIFRDLDLAKRRLAVTGDLELSHTFMQEAAGDRFAHVLLNLRSLEQLRKVVLDKGFWQSLVIASREQRSSKAGRKASKQVCLFATVS